MQGIFWAPAKKFQLGNFQKEVRAQNGQIIQHEFPIRFENHIFVTGDKKEISFVKDSKAFKAGVVVECETMEEATTLTAQQTAMKSITELHDELVEKTLIRSKQEATTPPVRPLVNPTVVEKEEVVDAV